MTKIKKIVLSAAASFFLLIPISPVYLSAEVCPPDRPACASEPTSTIGNGCAADKANPTHCLSHNPIINDLNIVVNVLSGLVGVVVVGSIILGGVQFIAAGDKADAVAGAKKRIINGFTALGAFLFIYTFLQWLIPGGVFK